MVSVLKRKDRKAPEAAFARILRKDCTVDGCPNFRYREWFTHKRLLLPQLIEFAPVNAYVLIRQMACTLLQPLRTAMERPVEITSGYRTPQINKAVGGSDHSQHLVCEAVDIVFRNEDGSVDMPALAAAQTWLREHCFHGVGLSLIHHQHMHLSVPDGFRQSLFQVKV